MIVRQSHLSSYTYCPQRAHLDDQVKAGAIQRAPDQLSMTAYGSVLHHAVSVMERLRFQKRPDAVDRAHATFAHYWAPENIADICPPVTIWAARQTYDGMLRKGHQTLDLYAVYLKKDIGKLLALEVEFNLPFTLDGEDHVFHGTMDRLSLRKLSGSTYVNVEDFKSGQTQKYLRFNAQFSGYCWATTQRTFWTDAWGQEDGLDLHERLRLCARRGTWISLKDGVTRSDAGWRGEQDYARFWAAIRGYIHAVKADVYPLSLTGANCFFCSYREGICGGVAVPDEQYGRPELKVVDQ